jgi:hypothetical protein
VSYPGGKNGSGVYQTLINLMPPHRLYIEPFLGMGGVMRHKRPAFQSIGIDSDIFVVANWTGHRVPGLTVDCGDGIRFLRTFKRFHSQTLIYCDPPYLPEACKTRPRYRHNLSREGHSRLLSALLLLSPQCMVMVSGYPHASYDDVLKDWRRVEFQAMTRGGSLATEVVWMNFPAPRELHDYRFLGNNFREREVIRRRIQRWKKRFTGMRDLERFAMFAALEEVRSYNAGSIEAAAPTEPAMSPAESSDLSMEAAIDESGDGRRHASPDSALGPAPSTIAADDEGGSRIVALDGASSYR